MNRLYGQSFRGWLMDLIGIPLIAFWPVIPLAALAVLAWWVWL
jgi:hypothetical protein